MKQIRPFNPNVPCTPGYCLTYVQDGFGVPPKVPYALADWEKNTYNHADKNFPDVPTPIWFTGTSGTLKEYGHVAVRLADSSVWSCSHPTNHTAMHFQSIDALNEYYSGQLIYLGWSEDVEEVKVMEETMKVDLFTARRLAYAVLGDKTALTGKRDADLNKNHVGKELTDSYIESLFNSKEATLARARDAKLVSPAPATQLKPGNYTVK